MAKPLNSPKAKYWLDIALKPGAPKPLTPIIDAITTWLVPSLLFG